MSGKHTAPTRKHDRQFTFANCIIVLCLAVSLIVTASVVYEYHRLNTVMPASVVTALLGLWGGELLLIVLRQVLGSDVMIKRGSSDGKESENSPPI